MAYPTALAMVHEGRVPRRSEHREALRQALGLDATTWAEVLAASQDAGDTAPALQQMVREHMLTQGLDERSLAETSGIGYPAIRNLVTKGSLPRGETLESLAVRIGLDPTLLQQAVAQTRSGGHLNVTPLSYDTEHPLSETQESAVPAYDDSTPSLAQLVSDTIVRCGSSVAAFARENAIPYVSLMKLMNSGQPPRRKTVLDPLHKALGIPLDQFQASVERSKSNPTPAEAPKLVDRAVNAFHAQLLKLVEAKGFTTKAFAEAADISVLTAAKLLKRGDLPGRQTTHEKLRNLMGLGKDEYFALLESARPTEEPEDQGPAVTTPGYVTVASGAAPVATTKGELFELIDRMSPAQLVALKQFLLNVL